MSHIRAAVFASGTGSNFEAMMNTENLGCRIVLLVSDQPKAAVLLKAKSFGVPMFVFSAKQYSSKAAYETEIVKKLREEKVDWIFLAGYMRLIGPVLLKEYEGKIVNIHPSYLPNFPGKDAIGQAYRAGVHTTGVTIHYVDEGMDTGPIICQESIVIHPTDTLEDLAERIHKVEHRLYPETIRKLCNSNK